MERNFKDRVLSLYRRTIRKHPHMKVPMIALSVFLLSLDRVSKRLRASAGRYIAVALALIFAFISCSFSSVIWGDGGSSFTDSSQGPQQIQTEESLATLAVETAEPPEQTAAVDAESESDEDIDLKAGEDLSGVDVVSGSEILGDMDMSGISDTEEETASDSAEFARDDWKLVLVNKNHPIAEDYEFELGTISGSMQCDKRVIPELYSMLEAAIADGVNLTVCSPYRNDDRQQMLFDKKVNKYMAQGLSYMESYKLASQAVTIPGSSEHQIGLAFDMLCSGYSALDEGFGDTAAGQWLAEHSYEYGFIIRYPQGKEEITGIEYEPWHLRYVGKNAAAVIHSEGLTLEEFWEKYL